MKAVAYLGEVPLGARVENGLPAVLKLLKEICDIPADIVSLRGARYANLKLQADELHKQLENKQNATSAVTEDFLKDIAQKLWEIIFALDDHARMSARQRYIAQHFTEYKTAEPLYVRWTELL